MVLSVLVRSDHHRRHSRQPPSRCQPITSFASSACVCLVHVFIAKITQTKFVNETRRFIYARVYAFSTYMVLGKYVLPLHIFATLTTTATTTNDDDDAHEIRVFSHTFPFYFPFFFLLLLPSASDAQTAIMYVRKCVNVPVQIRNNGRFIIITLSQ